MTSELPKYVVPGRPVCPYIHCPEKSAGIPHYHTFSGHGVRTVVVEPKPAPEPYWGDEETERFGRIY